MHFKVCVTVALFIIQVCNISVLGDERELVKVTTVLNAPFMTFIDEEAARKSTSEPDDYVNNKVQGYLVDLLDELSKEVNFDYELRLVKDRSYGAFNNTKWTGMIGEVLREEADLALADLTVTKRREEFVEFSYPFMTTGIGLLVKRPPYFDDTKPPGTNRTMFVYPVSGIKDLPFQNEVKFGCVMSGSTFEFFRQSSHEIYGKIGHLMVSNASLLSKSVAEGSQRVKDSNGRYAFFTEGAAIEYLTGKSCDFMKLGENIHTRAYAIAMRRDYHLKTRINMGLLALQERGILDKLKRDWFPQEKECNDSLGAVYARNALNLVLKSIK